MLQAADVLSAAILREVTTASREGARTACTGEIFRASPDRYGSRDGCVNADHPFGFRQSSPD